MQAKQMKENISSRSKTKHLTDKRVVSKMARDMQKVSQNSSKENHKKNKEKKKAKNERK